MRQNYFRPVILGFSFFAPASLLMSTLTFPVLASQYFENPTLEAENGNSYKISICVHSYRFPTQEDKCSKTAASLAANKFCQAKGYLGWEYYRTEDIGWKNRITAFWWTEKYIKGDLNKGFLTAPNTSGLFSLIVCNQKK
jgi:hypothetical protein